MMSDAGFQSRKKRPATQSDFSDFFNSSFLGDKGEKMNIFNQKCWVFSLTLVQQFKSLFKSLLTELQAS